MIEESYRLDGLPQSHLIGQQDVPVIVVSINHPIQGIQLVITQQSSLLVDGLSSCRVPQWSLQCTDVQLVEGGLQLPHLRVRDPSSFLRVVLPIIYYFVLLTIVDHLISWVPIQSPIEWPELIEFTGTNIQWWEGFPCGRLVWNILPLDQVQRIYGRHQIQLRVSMLYKHIIT